MQIAITQQVSRVKTKGHRRQHFLTSSMVTRYIFFYKVPQSFLISCPQATGGQLAHLSQSYWPTPAEDIYKRHKRLRQFLDSLWWCQPRELQLMEQVH